LCLEVFDGVASPTRRDQLGEVCSVIRRRTRCTDKVGRLEQRQLGDSQPVGGRLQRQAGAGRVTEDCRCAAGFDDQRREILDLAVDRVGGRIATFAPATAVVVVHAEVRREERREWSAGRPVVERANNQNERRPVAEPVRTLERYRLERLLWHIYVDPDRRKTHRPRCVRQVRRPRILAYHG